MEGMLKDQRLRQHDHFCDLSLNCVIRSNSPIEVLHWMIQPASAWALTSDCMKIVAFVGLNQPLGKELLNYEFAGVAFAVLGER